MNKKIVILSLLILLTSYKSYSQDSVKDTTKLIPYLSLSYQFFGSGGDLADRFGIGNIIGVDFNIKYRNNWEFGLGGGYMFGDKVTQENILHGMITSNGQILDDNAKYAEVFFFLRGWKIGLSTSKIIPILSQNPNSGIKLGVAVGYNQNWIRIENHENMIPQLSDEYKTYYDRKVGGIYTEQFLGYQFFSNKGLANFLAGFEFRQGFNTNLRSYNIDEMSTVSGSKVDLFFGFKIAWNILFYKRMSTGYYYN
jgi:hypothetical protein